MDGTIPEHDNESQNQLVPKRTFSPGAHPAPMVAPTRAQILLVHADAGERERLALLCRRAAPRACITQLSSGQDAIAHVLESPYDVVICDRDIETLDGLTLLRVIRGRHSRLELPVMFCAANADKSTRVQAFQIGASDFFSCDGCDDEFIARLQTQLNVVQMHRNALILMDELRVLVDTDPLTGLENRRAFLRDLRSEFSRAARTKLPCGMLLIDVDLFKRVNDSFGHPAGDAVLRAIAGLLRDGAREYDSVGRLGGEEFGVLLPEVDAHGATLVAERIRALVAEHPLGPPGVGHVTVSIGVALGPIDRRDNEDALLRRADEALYAAKRMGRNRVYVADDELPAREIDNARQTFCDD